MWWRWWALGVQSRFAGARWALALLFVVGCTAPETGGSGDGGERREGRLPGECSDRADNDGDGDFDCNDPDCAGAPACEEAEALDCDAVPDRPVSETVLVGARGYHGVAFDDSGNIVGSDNASLIRSDRDGNAEVFVPGLGVLQQMSYLPGGDLLVSSDADGGLYRITPDGGIDLVAPDLFAYSVLVGPDERVYFASTLGAPDRRIRRVDLATGEVTLVAELEEGVGARSLQFDREFSRLFVANAGGLESGTVFAIPLDDDLDPTGEPEVFASGLGDGWLDGIAVDRCGSLYVPDSHTFRLYRVSPFGEVETYVDWSGDDGGYGHDVVFGSGLGGWREDALYLPLPYGNNRVTELVIGVPSKSWQGAVTNLP